MPIGNTSKVKPTEEPKFNSFRKSFGHIPQIDLEEDEACLPSIRKMRGFRSFITLFLGGLILFGSPALYLMLKDSANILDLRQDTNSNITALEPQLARWSCWITLIWVLYIFLWFFVNVLPSLIIMIITFVLGYCSEHTRLQLEYIPALQKWIVWFVWQALATIGFKVLFFQLDRVDEWGIVYNILKCMTIFSAMFLVQRIFVQKIAIDFHKVAYEDRIIQSERALAIIQRLKRSIRGIGLVNIIDLFDTTQEGYSSEDELSIQKMPKPVLKTQSGPILTTLFSPPSDEVQSNERTLATSIPFRGDSRPHINFEPKPVVTEFPKPLAPYTEVHVDQYSTIKKRNTLQKRKLDKKLTIGGRQREPAKRNLTEITKDAYAASLASRLFKAIAPPNQTVILPKDFKKYFKTPQQAEEVFALFDRTNQGSITESELKWAVQSIYIEKRALNNSLGDLSQALGNLNIVLSIFSALLATIFCFPLFGISLAQIVPFTSIIVACGFIFGGSARSLFDGIIFLFVVHPYDPGDRILFDDSNYIVQEVNLLTTVLSIDGKTVYIPNNVMAQKTILNTRRSSDMNDYVTLRVSPSTPEESLRKLESMMTDFTQTQSRDYLPGSDMQVLEIDSMMTVQFSIPFKGSWQDFKRKVNGRTAFLLELNKNARELGIQYELPVQKLKMLD